MFAKSKQPKSASPNVEVSKAPATRSGGRSTPSIFSSDVTVKGTLRSDGDIQFDGKIEGNIYSDSVTIGEKAVITGEVVASHVIIRGRVKGSIRGRNVQLLSSAHVEGDILHSGLSVESGAYFDGNCRHAEDPVTAEMPKRPTVKALDGDQEAQSTLAEKAGAALSA